MSDPLQELDAIARRDRARRERRRRLRRWWRDLSGLWERRARAERDRVAREGEVVSPWQSGRVLVILLAGGTASIVAWQALGPGPSLLAAGATVGLLAAHRLEQGWWRSRLPFRLTGFDRIRGRRGATSEDETSYVACTLEVVLEDPEAGGDAARRALELLAARLGEAQAREPHFQRSPERAWRVGGTTLRGELDGTLWGDRWLEQWIRREAVLLHRAHPIREVIVSARFTGQAYRDPS